VILFVVRFTLPGNGIGNVCFRVILVVISCLAGSINYFYAMPNPKNAGFFQKH